MLNPDDTCSPLTDLLDKLERVAIAYGHECPDPDDLRQIGETKEAIVKLFAEQSRCFSEAPELLKAMEARKDDAYTERNRVVAALAWMAVRAGWKAGKARTAIEGWSEDWHGCIYINLPTGQVSWHYHDSHAPLFNALPAYTDPWDGHDTETKYKRVAGLGAWFALTPNDIPYAEALLRIVDEEAATWKRLHAQAQERMASNSSEHATAWQAVESVRLRMRAIARRSPEIGILPPCPCEVTGLNCTTAKACGANGACLLAKTSPAVGNLDRDAVLELAAKVCELPVYENGCAGRAGGDFPKSALRCAADIRKLKASPVLSQVRAEKEPLFKLPQPSRAFKVGDPAGCYIGDHQGELTEGVVVAILNLPGWQWPHYVIEIDTAMDPILEVRDGFTAHPVPAQSTKQEGK